MSRNRRFVRERKVSYGEQNDPYIDRLIRDDLEHGDWGEMLGPRGGRYVPVDTNVEIKVGESGTDFIEGLITYGARRMGRYARPSR